MQENEDVQSEIEESEEEIYEDHMHNLQTLRTPLTKILKEKVKCIE